MKVALNYLRVFSPLIGLLINVLAQAFSFRYLKALSLLRSVYLGFVVGFLGVFVCGSYIFLGASLSENGLVNIFIINLITYSCLGYCYFHFINLGETARRIRILREIYESEDGLTLEELLLRYNAQTILEKRIGRLINNGQIQEREGKYYIKNPIVLTMSKIITSLKLIILGKKSEFD